eukprot:scaffold24846_cov124-Skeletonema_marinoi.AAC.2
MAKGIVRLMVGLPAGDVIYLLRSKELTLVKRCLAPGGMCSSLMCHQSENSSKCSLCHKFNPFVPYILFKQRKASNYGDSCKRCAHQIVYNE